MKLRFADSGMIDALANIFRIGFGEPQNAVDYFFKNRFKPENCAVCVVKNRVVSALHLLDSRVLANGKMRSAYYLFAAATLPEYRGAGYMPKLIEFANQESQKRGRAYSVLLPESEKLYSYYERLGYQRFYKARAIALDESQIRALASKGAVSDRAVSHDAYKIYDIRSRFLKNSEHSLIWDENAVSYALNINKIYGGKTICSDEGYAICRPGENNSLEILEFVVSGTDAPNLLARIYQAFPGCYYKLSVPVCLDFFSGCGEIVDSGMIKPLSGCEIAIEKNDSGRAYLGLGLN